MERATTTRSSTRSRNPPRVPARSAVASPPDAPAAPRGCGRAHRGFHGRSWPARPGRLSRPPPRGPPAPARGASEHCPGPLRPVAERSPPDRGPLSLWPCSASRRCRPPHMRRARRPWPGGPPRAATSPERRRHNRTTESPPALGPRPVAPRVPPPSAAPEVPATATAGAPDWSEERPGGHGTARDAHQSERHLPGPEPSAGEGAPEHDGEQNNPDGPGDQRPWAGAIPRGESFPGRPARPDRASHTRSFHAGCDAIPSAKPPYAGRICPALHISTPLRTANITARADLGAALP